MSTCTTIQREDGTEKSLADWGVRADLALTFASKEKDTLSLNTVEPFDPATPQFAWGSTLILRTDRAGSAGAYTGGRVRFQGYVGQIRTLAEGGRQAMGYEVYGPWWLLSRLQFKQSRQVFGGWAGGPGHPETGPTFQTVFVAESFLGEDPHALMWTGAQAVAEIVAFANECWNPTKRGAATGRDDGRDVLRLGAVDCGQVFPKTRVQTVSCAEALLRILRFFPTTVAWFDYTTTPPTLHLREAANLATVALTLSASQERAVALAPQYDRQLAGVMIGYKRVDLVDGAAWPAFYLDKYPPAITDYTPNVLTHVVEIPGAKITRLSATVSVVALAPAFSPNPADRAALWTALDPSLQDPLVEAASLQATMPLSVTDGAGATVDPAGYPNILRPGSEVADWMGVRWVEATLQVQISFRKYHDAAHRVLGEIVNQRLTSYRVILTNAVSRTYAGQQTLDTGEAVPPLYPVAGSLAYAVYQGLSQLPCQGVLTLVDTASRFDLAPGIRLALTGPAHTYAALLVQTTRLRPHYGETRVEFGPAARPDAAGLVELWRASRWRTLYNLPSGRASGQASVTANFDTTGATPQENTAHGLGTFSLRSASFDQGTGASGPNGISRLALDAGAETLQIARLHPDGSGPMSVDGDGNAVGQVRIVLPDCGGKIVTLREMGACDPATGASRKVRVLASETY